MKKFWARGKIELHIETEFADDGTSLGDQAHSALTARARNAYQVPAFEVIDFEFDRIGGKDD